MPKKSPNEQNKEAVKPNGKLNKINHDFMHTENMRIIFEHLRLGNANTKRGIEQHTKLSWGTVSVTINELLDRGLITYASGEGEEQKIGHPTVFYKINSADNLLIGIDVNVESLRIVVTDLMYKVLFSKRELLVVQEKDFILDTISKLIEEAVKFIGTSKHILGIGFAVMGAVDRKNGVAIYSQHFKNWKYVNIKDIFENKYHLPVIVENDANCYAIAEMAIGKAGDYDNVLFLRLDLGIGMGIVINGEIYNGANGNAGEFGHICYEPDGLPCSCGRKGCLEAYAAVSGIANSYRRNTTGMMKTNHDNFYQDINIVQNLAETAAAGDEKAREYFTAAGKCLGRGLGSAITLLNPDIVVLGGMLMKFSDIFINELNTVAKENVWEYSEVNIMQSELDGYASAIGAAAALLQTIFFANILSN